MKTRFNFMKYACLFLMLIGISVNAWGASGDTWIASNQGYTDGTQYTEASFDDNITFAFGDGTNDGKYYDTGTGIRLYANGKLTVTAKTGCTLTSVVMTFSASGYTGTFSASTGSYSLSSSTGTWTGSASSVVLTNTASSGHARIQKIKVTYSSTGGGGGSGGGNSCVGGAAGTYEITPNNTFFNCDAFTTKPRDFTDATGEQNCVEIVYTAASSAYINASQCRMYNGTELAFSVPSGFVITAIAFTADDANWAGTHTADVGTMTDNKHWTGSANSVTITFAGTCRCTGISVTYAASGGDPTPGDGDEYNGHSITYNLTSCTLMDGYPSVVAPNLKFGFAPTGGATLPTSIVVKVGSTTLNKVNSGTSGYTWNKDYSGNQDNYFLNIPTSLITNDVTITITATGASANYTFHTPTCCTSPANGSNSTTLALPTATAITGYTFAGWTTNGSYTNSTTAPSPLYVEGNQPGGTLQLYAVYKKDGMYTINPICPSTDLKVTYNAGGGAGSVPTDATNYTDGDLVTVKFTPLPTRTGYTFAGWTDGDDEHPYTSDGDTKFAITQNTTLTALWTPITYSVRYNKNNGAATGSMSNSSHTYGTAKNLTNNAFSLTGYTFAGWTTNSDGTGTSYTNGQSVTNLASTQGAVVDLYAKWTIKTFTVTYDKNTGTGSMTDANSPYNYNAEVTVKENGFTAPTGKKFTGWNTATDGSGTSYAAGANFNITANTILYAQWDDACDAPTNLAVTSVGSKSITVSWTSGGAEKTEFFYNTTGTTPSPSTGANHTVNTGTTATLNGLQPNRKQYWWARSVCSESEKSAWVAGPEFTTNAVTYTDYITSCTSETEVTIYGNNDTEEHAECTIEIGSTEPICAFTAFTAPEGFEYNGIWTAATGGSQLYLTSGEQTSETVTRYINASGWCYTDNTTLDVYAQWSRLTPTSVVSGRWDYFGGETISLSVEATNIASDATYQWKHNGADIPGATGSTFTKPSCSLDDAGNYTCVVTNGDKQTESAAYGVKVYTLRGFDGTWTANYDFTRQGDTQVGVAHIELEADQSYEFKVFVVSGTAFGNNGTITNGISNWVFRGAEDNCHLTSSMGGEYVFTIDYSANANEPKISVEYPTANQAAGYKIYFANDVTNWATGKLHYRIGHSTWTAKQQMTQVPGTRNLWVVETPNFDGFQAWHIGDNSGWSGDNSIYKTKTGDTYQIGNSTVFQKSAVTQDITIIPGSTHSTGTDAGVNDNCEFWGVNKQNGLLTHNVSITAPTNGTVTVAYTDINGDAQNMTSGNADLAHTCILTISATPAAGYKLTALTVNGQAFTSGNEYDLTENAVIVATFTICTTKITFDKQGGSTGVSSVTATYGQDMPAATMPTRNGYTFGGYYDDAACTGTQYYTADGASACTWNKEDAIATLYAKWTANSIVTTLAANYTDGVDGSITVTYGTREVTAHTPVTRTGYTLNGFYTAKTGGSLVVTSDYELAEAVVTNWLDESHNWKKYTEGTLNAQWTVNTHNVTLIKGSDPSCQMTENDVPFGRTVTITAEDACIPTGYHFVSWTVDAGGAALADANAKTTTFTMPDADVQITANYAIDLFTVTYHHGDGTTDTEDVEYGASPVGVAAKVCAADRVFVGWSETEITTAVQAAPATVVPTTFSITADKHFYAVYASRNGGKAGEPASTTENFNSYETSGTYNATPIVCGDWTIVNACVSGISDVTNKMGSNAVVIQKATGAASSYMQTTNKVEGLKGISCKIATTDNSVNYFVQYSTDGSAWEQLATTGSHNGNRQKVTVSGTLSECVDAYVRIVLSSADGTGSTYRVYVDDIELTTQTRSYYLTDYATSCAKAGSMTLTYDAQGGTEQTAVTEAGWVTLPTAGECERGCYTLTGWLCSGDGEPYEPGAKYLFNHDVTMTAQWAVNSSAAVTVTYHTGLEGAETVTVENVHCGDVLTLVQVPEPAACGQNEFAGWAIGEFANTDNLSNIAQKYAVGTDVVMGNMELHAIWKNGKSDFTKYTDDPADFSGTYVLVDPTSSKALSATLAPTPVTIVDNKISTDEAYIQWEVVKTAKGYSIHSIDGYLNITADATRAMGLSDAVVDTWNIAESSSNGVYNLGITFGGSDRRVCYNSKHNKWFSYKNRTSGNLYKLTGDGPSVYTMDGFCPHIYHATGVSEMTSGTGVSVMAQENGMIIVENTSVVPVAQKVSGADVFEVTINPESTGANGDGSLNYNYSVKFTPTAGNQTYTATYKFIGTDETEDAKHIASEEITFTGYSLPDQFAIVVNRGGQYYALPGGIAAAGTPNAVPVTVVGGEVVDLDASNAYHVGSGTVVSEDRTTVRLITTAGALWATNADNANINDYSGALTAANTSSASEAAKTQTQWTLERVYNESTDAFEGYHLSSDANAAKALFYQSTNGHWGYYNNSYYSGGAYNGEIFFLPIQAQFGDVMDIVDWSSNSVVINMNGYRATAGAWGVKNAGGTMLLSGDRETDRTLEVSTAALVADQYLNIKVYGNANNAPAEPVVESNRNYKIPHVMTGTQTISSAASYSANSILYVKSGVTTVNVNLNIGQVIVCPGAELVIASGKTLNANKVVLRTKAFESPVLTDNGTLNGQVYYTRIVADKSQSYQFALPFDVTLANVKFSNGRPAPLGNAWGLNTYDAAGRAENGKGGNWVGVNPNEVTKLDKNTGYQILSTSAYYTELYFPVAYTKDVANAQVAVVPHDGTAAQRDPMNANWNFISSPYTSNFTCHWSSPSAAIKLNELYEDNVNFHQYVPSVIKPAAPFYYQAEESGYLQFGNPFTFVASAPATVAARQAVEEEVAEQWIQLFYDDNNGMSDETNIYLHPTKFSIDYELGVDIEKMSTTGSRPFIYTQLPCGNLAFAAVPDSLAETRIPLAVHAPQNGEMVFSLRENEWLSRLEHVYLVDDTLGQVTDLLTDEYIYPAQAGTQAGRFYLRAVFRTPQIATGVEDTGGGNYTISVEGNRLVVNGLAYGERVCLYDAVGHLMQMTTATGTTLDMNVPATGVYLLQVGKDVKKLILDK